MVGRSVKRSLAVCPVLVGRYDSAAIPELYLNHNDKSGIYILFNTFSLSFYFFRIFSTESRPSQDAEEFYGREHCI